MNACNNNKNNNFISVPYIDLHDTKKIDITMERVQGAHNNHRLLINDYIKAGLKVSD